ncbi:sugar transferase [Phormidium tenue FACHB-886]|nr:sugar transferase [Phormidium tenue FACHB-886]
MNGICTLANDQVYDQLVALLNSIEAQMGADLPVCIYPYDDKTERIAAEIAKRPNVQLYEDRASIQHWDQFVRAIWDVHPTARQRWGNVDSSFYYRVGTHRRLCAFDAPFDRFLYMDADTLLLNSVDSIFNQLDTQDWITYDFQFKDLSHVYEDSPRLRQIFSDAELQSQIFCSGFYAAKRNLFDLAQQNWLLSELKAGDAATLYPMAPDQTVLNYMVMKSGIFNFNLALELPPDQRTGCCVTSPNFTVQDNLLFDRNTRLTYLHFIGLSSSLFTRLCAGENLDFSYRDLFLHYRYLHEPQNRPRFSGTPRPSTAPPSLPTRLLRKLKLYR